MDADKIVKAFFNEEPMVSVTLSMLEPIGRDRLLRLSEITSMMQESL